MKSLCKNCKDLNWFIECKCGCGQIRSIRDKSHRLRNYIDGHNRRNIIPHNFKGVVICNGYRMIYKPNKGKYIYEHRLIWEEFYKVCLLPWIHIHHKDGNRSNNNIFNLQPLYNKYHISIHKTKNMDNRLCQICGSYTTKITNNGRPKWFCYNKNYICYSCYNRMNYLRKKGLAV